MAARNQADFRRDINPRDQFGRKWQMSIEIATGYPTGGVFQAGWMDPLRTPMKYVKMVKNEDGQIELGKVHVDFPHWISDIEQALEGWTRQLVDNALTKNVEITSMEALEKHPILLRLTGPKPWPGLEALRAAQAGDKALLGLSPMGPKERAMLGAQTLEDLREFVLQEAGRSQQKADDVPPSEYQAFVGWCFRTGACPKGDLKKAAELWAEHRKNLQPAA